MNRTEFQRLAEVRVREAEALLAAGLWDGAAYYLAGYAVECGLKACILARIEREGVIFEERKFSEQCWTHDPTLLLGLAGLTKAKDAGATADPAFRRNWIVVNDWSETSRYRIGTPEADARVLIDAITDPQNGVLPWISSRW